MAESVWEKGKLKAVYQPAGKRENGELRFRRANFDVLDWAAPGQSRSSVYVIPLGICRVLGGDLSLNVTDGSDAQIGQEFGYYAPEVEFVDLNEGDGKSDTWESLHAFGYV